MEKIKLLNHLQLKQYTGFIITNLEFPYLTNCLGHLQYIRGSLPLKMSLLVASSCQKHSVEAV